MKRLLFLILLLPLFFLDPIATRVVAWKIKKTVDSHSVQIAKGVIIVESPSLDQMCAKRLLIEPKLHLWHLELRGTAIEPRIALQKKSTYKKSRWLPIRWKIALVDGILALEDGRELDANGMITDRGLQAHLTTNESSIDLSFSGNTLEMDLENVDISTLDGFLPHTNWSLERGNVSGHLKADWEKRKFEGKLSVVDASMRLFPWSIDSISGELSFVDQTVSLNIIGAFGHKQASCLFFAQELENGDISLTVEGPMRGIAPLLPRVYRDKFPEENFSLEAILHARDLEGTLTIDESLTIPFGLSYTEEGPSGWFTAKGLDGTTFIQPLLKGNPQFSATLDLQATFDREGVYLTYSGNDVVLESRFFKAEAPHIENATHQFLLNGKQRGLIPMQNGTYLEKKTGLFFEKTSCQVNIEENVVTLSDITTTCEEIAFTGSMLIDAPHRIHAQADSIRGSIEGTRRILARARPAKFWNLPATGEVEGALTLQIKPTLACRIEGRILRGSLGPLKNIQTEITYDQNFTLTNLSATIGENTPLTAETIAFHKGDVFFALQVGEKPFSGKIIDRELHLDQEFPLSLRYDRGFEFQFGNISACFKDQTLQILEPFPLQLTEVDFGQMRAQCLGYSLGFELENGEGKISVNETLGIYCSLGENPELTRIEGNLDEISLHLVRDHRKEDHTFYGTASVPMDSPRLPPTEIVGILDLSGTFSLKNGFKGNLHAEELQFRDHTLSNLQAKCLFSRELCTVRRLRADFGEGKIHIPLIEGEKGEEEWNIFLPRITATHFHPVPAKPRLIIKELSLRNLEGTNGGIATFTGQGDVIFDHPPKRDLRGTILALPDELLGKIGLDFGNLIPAKGHISFQIEQGKAHLLHFNNVFSHAERSQFFLDESSISTVDWNGDLDVRVRMRQYNLILKPAELFVVAIEGNLKDPSFKLLQP